MKKIWKRYCEWLNSERIECLSKKYHRLWSGLILLMICSSILIVPYYCQQLKIQYQLSWQQEIVILLGIGIVCFLVFLTLYRIACLPGIKHICRARIAAEVQERGKTILIALRSEAEAKGTEGLEKMNAITQHLIFNLEVSYYYGIGRLGQILEKRDKKVNIDNVFSLLIRQGVEKKEFDWRTREVAAL